MTKKQTELLLMFQDKKEWIKELINSTEKNNIKEALKGWLKYIEEKIDIYSKPVRNCKNCAYYDEIWQRINNDFNNWNNNLEK